MALTDRQSTRTVLAATGVYFLVCGLSAIFLPALWLWAAGLSGTVSPELAIVFRVFGAYLLALAIGALLAARSPEQHSGLILTLLICNVFDFITTTQAVISGSLPAFHGTLLVAVTVLWSTLLSLAWIGSKRHV